MYYGGLLLNLPLNLVQSFCITVAISNSKVGDYVLGYLVTIGRNKLFSFSRNCGN